jgi:glycosyltransferase involved in cell wall biosynthesis
MKVSIVTPSYNQGKFIERTLMSVAEQSGADIEHVVFDGGSTDNTVDILENFRPAVRWVSEKDRGQADAVNKGIMATNGEIIGWLNSDDIYYPNAIRRVTEFLGARNDVDVVYGMADHIDLDDRAFETYPTEPWNFARLRESCFLCQPAVFFRRRVVAQHGLLDEKLHYCMDYEYWLRLAKSGAKFAFLQEKLAGSRLYAENKTLGSRPKVHAEINDMQKALFGTVPDRWLWNYGHSLLDHRTDRHAAPRSFAFRLVITVTRAAWHWNGRISPEMAMKIIGLWRSPRPPATR